MSDAWFKPRLSENYVQRRIQASLMVPREVAYGVDHCADATAYAMTAIHSNRRCGKTEAQGVATEVQRRLEGRVPAPEVCEMANECHGSQSWCDTCGDVDRLCRRVDCTVHYLRCESCHLVHREPFAEGDECTRCEASLILRQPATAPAERPTYRIPAREVVPGMLFQWVDAAHQITEVERRDGGIVLWWGQTGKRLEIDGVVTVQLLGPSPRELSCTCWEDALHHDGEYRWEDEVIRQHGASCAEYAQRRAELACTQPSDHAPDCPVAPVPGRHGGLRLWPAPFRGKAWTYDADCGWWECGNTAIDRTHLAAAGMGGQQNGLGDMVLQCFYLALAPAPERRPAPAWDPYGTDLDLAVRYG